VTAKAVTQLSASDTSQTSGKQPWQCARQCAQQLQGSCFCVQRQLYLVCRARPGLRWPAHGPCHAMLCCSMYEHCAEPFLQISRKASSWCRHPL
jgi:hypothetical protein